MVKLSKWKYNYRVTQYDKNNKLIIDKLYSQLKDIQVDFTFLTKANLIYLSHNDSNVRMSAKYKNLHINKIHPILIFDVKQQNE